MPEPTTAALVELVAVGKHECVTCRRCATTFAAVHPACPYCSLSERLETAERLNAELTLGQEYMEKWSDRGDFLCYRHEWLALEARIEEVERALRIVRDWIREGIGTEAEAAEAMDAALATLSERIEAAEREKYGLQARLLDELEKIKHAETAEARVEAAERERDDYKADRDSYDELLGRKMTERDVWHNRAEAAEARVQAALAILDEADGDGGYYFSSIRAALEPPEPTA